MKAATDTICLCLVDVWGKDTCMAVVYWAQTHGVVFCSVFIIDGGVYRGDDVW